MAETLRNDAKKQIIKILRDQKYNRYADLVGMFDIYLTDAPDVVGYMVPNAAKIVLNKDLDIYQVSVIVRHEILHEYLTHAKREQKFNAAHPDYTPDHQLMNIAADMEISNRGYTHDDKVNVRSIRLHGQKLKGLVTEDHDPSWVTLSFEELYEKLLQEREQTKDKIEELMKQYENVSQRELEDIEDAAQNAVQQSAESSQQASSDKKPTSSDNQKSDEDDEKESSTVRSSKQSDETSDNAVSNRGELSSEEAQELADEASELVQQQYEITQKTNDPFMQPEDKIAAAEIAARAEEIKNALADAGYMDQIAQETASALRQDTIRRNKLQASKKSTYAAGSSGNLSNFKLDLKRFLSNVEADVREKSYKTFDPRYEGTEFNMPGKAHVDRKIVPKINIYWDTSGSFQDPRKTAGARAAIDVIHTYVKRGLIQTFTYYHSDRVYTEPHSGGNDGNAVVRHIQETKPDNVIIITDGDLSDTSIATTVPGAVWMLFYDYSSEGLIKNLRGKKQSKWYMIDYN